MKKNFVTYVIIWIISLVVFNLITFLLPNVQNVDNRTAGFWIGYALITLALTGQVACSWYVLKEKNATKLFYKLSLYQLSYSTLAISLIVGILLMILVPKQAWIAAIICLIILAIDVTAMMKAKLAVDTAVKVDEKIEQKTTFIKTKIAEAQTLMSTVDTEEKKRLCKRVYEALRYSDPVSDSQLERIEREINECLQSLKSAIGDGDLDLATVQAQRIEALIAERNDKCKLLK